MKEAKPAKQLKDEQRKAKDKELANLFGLELKFGMRQPVRPISEPSKEQQPQVAK